MRQAEIHRAARRHEAETELTGRLNFGLDQIPLAPGEDVMVVEDRGASRKGELGWSGATPFLTLSFLALSVIPSLKITDRGLVDVDRFELVPLQA